MSLCVKYYDVPGVALEQIQAAGEGTQPFSDPAYPVYGWEGSAYATLENGGWPLDGSRVLLPDAPEGFWWSAETSDSEGNFAQPPTLTLTLPEAITTTGLSFTFWPETEQWCSRVLVSWYNSGTLLTQALVYPDSPYWTLEKTVEGFDKLQLQLYSTNVPGQFAKLQRIELGQVWRFEKDELVSVQLVNEIDPMLCDLSVDTMQVQVRSKSASVLSPQQNQRLVLCRDGKPIATHYITGSSREEKDLYTLQAQSGIGMLEDTFLGGMYSGRSLPLMLNDILGGQEVDIDSSFDGVLVSGYLPVCTRRQALQQLALAIGAVVTTHGNGTYYVHPLVKSIQGTFRAGQIFQGAKVTTQPRYSRVEVAAHSYTPSAEEKMLLEEEKLGQEEVLLTFDEPHYDYQVSGAEVLESGANFLRVQAWGPVTVTAKPYIHNAKLHAKRDPQAVSAERGNVLTVDSATLVHSGNVSAVLQRLYSTAQLRQELAQEAVISGQQAGQRVASVNPWGTQTRGYITAMDSNLTEQGQVASLTILGVEVTAENLYRYSGEFYAGEKEVLC